MLILNDYYVLLNLHKTSIEAKFHENFENRDTAGSPIVAHIMNEDVDMPI